MKTIGRLLISVMCLLPGIPLGGAAPPSVPESIGEQHEGLAAPEPMPSTLFAQGQEFPVWVDESNVLLPSGEVNPTFFHPHIKAEIETYLELPPKEGKIRLTQIDEEIINAPAREDLTAVVDTSTLVLLGRVTGRSQGFHGYTAGSLFRVLPLRTFKGSATQKEYFFFLPIGELHLNGFVLSKSDPRYAALPAPGDEVVLLVARDWRNSGPFLWLTDEASVWTIKRTSGLSLPRKYLEKSSNLIGARRDVVENLIGELVQRGRGVQ